MNRTRLLTFLVVALVLSPGVLHAVGPMPQFQVPPLLSYPCDSATHGCNSCGAYTVNEALQTQASPRSDRSSETPDSTFGICNGTHMWCKVPPGLQPPTYSVIPVPPGAGIRISVGYDFPNNYCLVWDVGDACNASNWPTPPGTHLTRLQLLEGANTIYDVPAVFENGTWTPTIVIAGCNGSVHTYTLRATNSGFFADCLDPLIPNFVEKTLVVTFPDSANPFCNPPKPDLRPCPGC